VKLSAVYFDDTVCIPGGKDVGGGMSRQDLRDSTFLAAEGWDIGLCTSECGNGVHFSLWREGMAAAAIVGGYGYTYIAAARGTATVTSIDGPGANAVTLTNADEVRTFVPATQEQHEAMGLRPKRRRK
jgi:hypothetical protein